MTFKNADAKRDATQPRKDVHKKIDEKRQPDLVGTQGRKDANAKYHEKRRAKAEGQQRM